MEEYTYDNVIINPTQEDVESLIGKEVYFHDNPTLCLEKANERSADNLGILAEINPGTNPFCVKKYGGAYHSYACIIEKKEDPKPEYTPFESMEEFVERYVEAKEGVRSDSFESNLLQCGMWLKERGTESDAYCMVIEMFEEGVFVGQEDTFISEGSISTDFTSWRDLYLGFNFLDGSPCGKLKESK